MLVLSRKKREKIQVADSTVTFTILQIKGGTVKIGIDAPPEIDVRRGEIQPIDRNAADASKPD